MLRRKFENIDIAGDEVAEYVGKGIHGIGGEGESILQELGGIRPLGKAGENVLAQIMRADVNLDFPIGRSPQIAGTDNLTLLDEDDGIAGDFDFAEEMGIEEDSGTALALVADDVTDKVAAHGIEAGCRFIEKDEVGFMNQGLRKADTLHHALRKSAKAAVTMRREANKVEIGGYAIVKLGGSETAQAAVKKEELSGGQPVIETKIFGEEADFAANFDVREAMAQNLRLTAGGLYQAEKHLDGGALPGAVGAEEAEDFAAPDLQGKATDGHLGTELFAKADGFNGQVIVRQRVLRSTFCCAR
jgi:hypothetical protein